MHYQNGGASLSTAYADILARYGRGLKASASSKLNALFNEYNTTGFSQNGRTMLDVDDNPLSGLAPYVVLKTIFGVETDGLHLTFNPDYSMIPSSGEEATTLQSLGGQLGVKGISFRGNTYNFLYSKGTLFVTSDTYGAVRLKVGGFNPGDLYSLFHVKDGLFAEDSTPLVADENGILSLTADFGASSYIKIEKKSE